jgi:capsular polysaccharide biosynthesis protein
VSEQLTNLSSTTATLRRRSRILTAAAVVGLAAGVAYVFATPPPLTSTTLVLLPTPALAGSSSSEIDTQVRIATSASILTSAGQSVVPALPRRAVEKMVKVSAPTNQIVQIDATSTKGVEAETLSQAVADSYVGYVSNTAREVSAAVLADLKVRRDALQKQITQLQDEFSAASKRHRAADPNSSEATQEAQLLARLRAEQADLSLQLDKVLDKIATDIPGSSAGEGTSVIQHATEATGPSTLLRLVMWAPLGAVICTILAAVVLLILARRDPRIRLRDDIADAIGSPVLASVRSRPQRSVAGWSTLLETYEATPVESWAFRQLLRALAPVDHKHKLRPTEMVSHPQSVTVVTLAGDERGVAIAPQLVAFASSHGIVTRLVTAVGQESAAALWAACVAERETNARQGLHFGDVSAEVMIDLTIILVIVDRKQPNLSEAPASEATILAVAPGTATEQELARVALAVDDSGRSIDGIVVADPDKTDRTSGRHTMDERASRPALPVRLTGVPSSKASVGGGSSSRS